MTQSAWNVLISSVADSMGHGGTRAPLLQMAGHGGTVSRRTANKKLTKLYFTITKALTKTTNCAFEAKKWRDTTKKKFPALRAGSVPPTFAPNRCPHFHVRSGATAYIPDILI